MSATRGKERSIALNFFQEGDVTVAFDENVGAYNPAADSYGSEVLATIRQVPMYHFGTDKIACYSFQVRRVFKHIRTAEFDTLQQAKDYIFQSVTYSNIEALGVSS